MQTTIKKKKWVSYITTMRLSKQGQLVLPKEFRDEQGLESGSPISILRIGNSLLLLPEMSKFNALCDSIENSLTAAGVISEEVLKTLPETREEVFAELFPKLAKRKRKYKAVKVR